MRHAETCCNSGYLGRRRVRRRPGGLLPVEPGFDPLGGYISKLGAVGQPHALLWNIIGFFAVGTLLAGFGWACGHHLRDRWIGICLMLFDVGFAATGLPINLADERSPLSTAHVVAICLGLAAWMFGLARMTYLLFIESFVRRSANIAAVLVVVPIVGQLAQLWAMPVTHRLVFAVVFGWTAITSIRWLCEGDGPTHPKGAAHESATPHHLG